MAEPSTLAARLLVQTLRLQQALRPEDAIVVESLAYSTLLAGEEFRRWRRANPARVVGPSTDAVTVVREGDTLAVRLTRPERRNALDAAARGALSDALDIAIADPSLRVVLDGEGLSFCSGGDLDEFGTADDMAVAHDLRMRRGPALRMATVGPRTTALVHGPVVGAGVELAAFAGRVIARAGTTFRLPEVSMGLIPGAGGTVSITRRIGCRRTAWLVLSGEEIDVRTALAWGLVDEVQPDPGQAR